MKYRDPDGSGRRQLPPASIGLARAAANAPEQELATLPGTGVM